MSNCVTRTKLAPSTSSKPLSIEKRSAFRTALGPSALELINAECPPTRDRVHMVASLCGLAFATDLIVAPTDVGADHGISTGKELVALIHAKSRRACAPLCELTPAAIPEE